MGVHSVGLTAALEESLHQEAVDKREHDRVGGRDREGGATWGERDEDTRGEDKEEGTEDKELCVHFYNWTQKNLQNVRFITAPSKNLE